MILKARNQMNDNDNVAQTCIKIRLFGEDDLLNEENVEKVMDKFCDILVDHGFDNTEYVKAILSVNATDLIPEYLDESGVTEFLTKYEKSAMLMLPSVGEEND